MQQTIEGKAYVDAATFGLIGFSSSARVGKARVKANIGKE